jgi:hypothetical protein
MIKRTYMAITAITYISWHIITIEMETITSYKETMKTINCAQFNITDERYLKYWNPSYWNCLDLSGNKYYLLGEDQHSFFYNSFIIQVFLCPTCTDYLALVSLSW